MAKMNLLKDDGGVKLPPGFVFQPTDEELVFQYLLRKVLSCPLPASIIPEIRISNFTPWDFPGDLEQDKYVFSQNPMSYGDANRTNCEREGGCWKSSGTEKKVATKPFYGSRGKETLMGLKRTLVFYKGKHRTPWVVDEYRLIASVSHRSHDSLRKCWIPMGNWVLCHAFFKKQGRKTKKRSNEASEPHEFEGIVGLSRHNPCDVTGRNDPTCGDTSSDTSSSSSSPPAYLRAEVSSKRQIDWEETGCSNET